MTRETNRSGRVKLSFERRSVVVALSQLVPLKTLRPGTKESKKYTQIMGSIRVIGLVEAPVVAPDPKQPGRYFLLDGHLRIEALKELGIEMVECLVSTDDEAYTYNKRINRIAAVQEYKMIKRAVERGVPEDRIAEALGLEVGSVRRRAKMLEWDLCRRCRNSQRLSLSDRGVRHAAPNDSDPPDRGGRVDAGAE